MLRSMRVFRRARPPAPGLSRAAWSAPRSATCAVGAQDGRGSDGASGASTAARVATALAASAALLKCGQSVCCDAEAPKDLPWAALSDTAALWRREWQPNWDGRAVSKPEDGAKDIPSPKVQGRVRHLVFVRHGQYDTESEEQGLTELGREQSHLVGKRLEQMLGAHFKDKHHDFNVHISAIHVSSVLRAQQTAQIISEHLPGVPFKAPDPLLAEGMAALPYPQKEKEMHKDMTANLWEESARIELAFRKYVHRDVDHKALAKQAKKQAKKAEKERKEGGEQAPEVAPEGEEKKDGEKPEPPEHVYEIIVCHCNVIRYFVMRSLQLPPEAWLRLGGYNTGLTEISIRPNGTVGLVRMGDTGHLPIEMTTFH